jgi:alkylated DNA repair dioxygenase AlkB
MSLDLTWQPSLLDAGPEPAIDETFAGAMRIDLDKRSWIERVPGWVSDSDALFAHLLAGADWGQRTRKMWDHEVLEPRLTSWWGAESGKRLEPPILERMRRALSARYGVEFDSMGLNLYRDGRDSVAWHGDRIAREIAEPLVAIVSVGEPRRFLLRPKTKGTGLATRRLLLGRGELLVTGGTTQRAWEHSVPKVASAGPRMSLTFRHGLIRPSGSSSGFHPRPPLSRGSGGDGTL